MKMTLKDRIEKRIIMMKKIIQKIPEMEAK